MPVSDDASIPDYAELHVISNYSFLRSGSTPREMVARADELGYRAVAITDECSLAGMVQAWIEAKDRSIELIVGSEFYLEDGLRLILLATDRYSYGKLSHFITLGRRAADKGHYHLTRRDLQQTDLGYCLCIWVSHRDSTADDGRWLKTCFKSRCWIGVALHRHGDRQRMLQHSEYLSDKCNLPRTAIGSIDLHHPQRQPLRDTLHAIRLGSPLSELGYSLFANGESYLRDRGHIARLFPADMIGETVEIARQCRFDPAQLRYEYPENLVPPGYTDAEWLRHLTEKGARTRWPSGISTRNRNQIEKELKLIADLRYEPYFLTVHDVVRYAQRQGILCQGRGSAANSTVCYCLGITEVDPDRVGLLFERFISKERNEPPDIDVDFEHEQREEVIQYIYRKYGRDRAAIAATVVTYQPRSALRDVGKALGLSLTQVDRMAKTIAYWDDRHMLSERLREAGFDPEHPLMQTLMHLVDQILGFPRHLSQHVGGFVISRGVLSELVPVENASMPDRTVIQWEKDDLEALGLLKIDVLALGMLSAVRKAFDYIEQYTGTRHTMSSIPEGDADTYAMIQRADTVGVFQIESRAQMSMLPRLKPANYYDLVIEIAIVRPGPIQGEMVHPYLLRRQNPDSVTYPSEELESVLHRTLGVPIFQEQVMQIAIVAAGFTPGEADQLRRSMAAWKRRGGLGRFEQKLIQGMLQNGYEQRFAEQVFNQIKGFGDYGFPESHSASFALIAYVSSWLKCHQPAAFYCGLLNSQPMGFYRPAQLVNDARHHRIDVRPVDINQSDWDCSLQPRRIGQPALRLGLRMVKGLSQEDALAIVSARKQGPFQTLQSLVQRSGINKKSLAALAAADAFRPINGNRHRAYWDVAGVEESTPVFPNPKFAEATPMLNRPSEWQQTLADYESTGLTLNQHPLALLREQFNPMGVCPADSLGTIRNGDRIRVAGLVINRQRPMTASGVVFTTLEDETGQSNIIIWPKIVHHQRRVLLRAKLLMVTGKLQIESNVIHIIAERLHDCSYMVQDLCSRSRDFH
ncbi:MAG: error-prone DNA polymerase [Pseudomonadota bacterium]